MSRQVFVVIATCCLAAVSCGSPETEPVVTRTASTLGVEGGALTLDGATLTLQAGSLSASTEVVLEHEPGAAGVEDDLWRIQPGGVVLVNPAELRLPLPEESAAPALFWSGPPTLASRFDRLHTWRQGDHLVTQVTHFGEGHLGPADEGMMVHLSAGDLHETSGGGLLVTSRSVSTRATWSATGGGGVSGGEVLAPSGVARYGPLHEGASRHTLCEANENCTARDLTRGATLAVQPGRGAGPSDGTLELEASGLTPLAADTDLLFVGENTAASDWQFGVLSREGVTAGSTSATVRFRPMRQHAPEEGDRGWLFEYRKQSSSPIDEWHRMTGYGEVSPFTLGDTGTTLATVEMTEIPADDTFVLELDAEAWSAQMPDVQDLVVYVYGTWGRWAPRLQHGAPLAILLTSVADLDGPLAVEVPSSPLPAWQERVLIESRPPGLAWELPRSEVDGRRLPPPPFGRPSGLTLNGEAAPEAEDAALVLDPTVDLVIEWDPVAEAGIDYDLDCYFASQDLGGFSRFRLSDTHAVIEADFLQAQAWNDGFCELTARPAAPLLTAPPERALQSSRRVSFVFP